ncbi:MAG: UDP-glucose 4-epimerase GalE [Haliangiales bacterium]
MKVLVAGGAGYIGSVVVEQLIAAGDEVLVIDNLVQGHLAAVHPRAAFLRADLADTGAIRAAVAEHQPEAVMHFAARTLVGESMQAPFGYLRDNVSEALNLFEVAIDAGVRRVIFSSTANLFGTPETVPITEREAIDPGSPYGESKYIIERALAWLDQLYQCRYACLRYFNACGASVERGEDHSPETHLIPIVLQVAQGKRAEISIFGDDYDTPDGTCVRDYVHVVDLAQAHILALRALDRGSRVYNLGTGNGFSVREVIEAARAVTGHPIPATVGPRRPGAPATLVAASDRIQRELGWQPRYTDMHAIIDTAWRWHQAHPDGYPANPPAGAAGDAAGDASD